MFRQAAKSMLKSCPSSSRNVSTTSARQRFGGGGLFASGSPITMNNQRQAMINMAQQVRHATTSETGAFYPHPERPKLGLTGITATVSFGLLLGATISKNIAAFLEENELFVPSDDDDDD